MALITCRSAVLGYDGNIAVSGLEFEVLQGDYLCIVGENGSGKSTLIKGLLGLKNPVSGSITTGDGLRATEIGYLPQQSAAQKDFPASVFEVVLSGFQSKHTFSPFYTKAEKALAEETLEKLNIENLKYSCYRELSGGQQQRALLARALCATEKLLLLDEPVTGLDPLATKEFYELVGNLNKKENLTIVMVSHDIRAAVEHAGKILHLGGHQLFFGTTQNYLETDLAQNFLGGQKHA